MGRRYELEYLRALRRQQAAEAADDVTSSAHRRSGAERELVAATADRTDLENQAGHGARLEVERLDRGEATAADMARAAAYEAGLRGEVQRRRGTEERLAERLQVAKRDESAAIARMARAQNSAEAVERHRVIWARGEKTRSDEASEEAVTESRQAARRRGRGGVQR